MQVKTQTFPGRVCVAAALAQAAIMKAQGISARNNAVSPLDLLADLQERAAQASNSLAAVMQNCATARVISPEDAAKIEELKNEVNALAKQQELLKSDQNLAQCRASLTGMNGALESMRLKISNLKVNTQHTDILDELSSDLQAEMSALEDVLHNVI